ncbi:MAG: hypothetical protein TEF_18665 [Rhizobiales bacterium NRL2]|jgi:uncharacterized protein YdeI (BOF family)|nr:MAG: hypothetical protein TEF_18665 [Rhizobiales bacterium NRL2]
MTNRKGYLGICCAAALLAAPAAAADNRAAIGEDEEWISLTGTVESVEDDDFVLVYPGGGIAVEMDEHEVDAENWLRVGDRVTVSGEVDEDFYDRRSIEADSVYVPRLNEYFYADREDGLRHDRAVGAHTAAGLDRIATASDDEFLSVTGRVVAISGNELMVDVGGRTVNVDGGDLDRPAIDEDVDVGDLVSVSGEMDAAGLFNTEPDIDADSITVLRHAG